MNDDKLTLHFIHPTDSGQTLTAAISPTATPAYVLNQLRQSNWLADPGPGGQYKLRNPLTSAQLLDDVPLGQAGVVSGTDLAVEATASGA